MITEATETYEELYYKAYTDIQLDCYNRHYLERYMLDKTGDFVFIDVDGLKQINDTEGHDAGDRYLELIVTKLKSHGTVARYGGDEFVLEFRNWFQKALFEFNQYSEFSYGIGTGRLRDILKELDGKMYAMKEKRKEG